MKRGRLGTALALVLVLAIVSASAIGLSVWPAAGGDSGGENRGDPVDWRREASLDGGMQRFTSLAELVSFAGAAPSYTDYWYWSGRGDGLLTSNGLAAAEASAPDYSATNVQVEGVDEADIVKSDGRYIYLAIDNRLIIAWAYPPEEAKVVWEHELGGSIAGIFISGDKLAVLEAGGPVYASDWRPGEAQTRPDRYREETSIRVYDVADRVDPVLDREVSVDGYYVCARMIGDWVYLVANGPAWVGEDETGLPWIDADNGTVQIPAEEIWHSPSPDGPCSFTTIMSVNVADKETEAAHETLLLGGASTVYVSLSNIYVTFPTWSGASGGTSIHRLHINQGRIDYHATGDVPGSLLNQFSLDERGEYLRVATTVWNRNVSPAQARQTNNVYVLDQALDITGHLENLAPGESIHSARFMGSRCYLVTFQKVDPLFVIDLADPLHPAILGELKITGYSDYLHPYDENHIIGIGKEAAAAEEGDFAWYQGVKISLFDVSNVAHPVEIAKYQIGDRGTDSPVLSDHKAFLFDRSRNLLVLPVSLAQIDRQQYPEEIPSWAYGTTVWQGAYVFDVSLEQGLSLRGRIAHWPDRDSASNGGGTALECAIERSLYIGDVLYTISDAQIGLNDLATLAEIGRISLAA